MRPMTVGHMELRKQFTVHSDWQLQVSQSDDNEDVSGKEQILKTKERDISVSSLGSSAPDVSFFKVAFDIPRDQTS